MQERRDVEQVGCRKGGMVNRWDAGKEGYRTSGCKKGGMQNRRDSGQGGYRSEGIHEWKDAGEEVFGTGLIQERIDAEAERWMKVGRQDRKDAGQEGCRTGGM